MSEKKSAPAKKTSASASAAKSTSASAATPAAVSASKLATASAAKAAPAPAAKPAPAVAAKQTAATAPALKPATLAKPVSAGERSRMIAEAAYFLAERRGFSSGYAVQDWLAAERQVDAMLKR